MRPSEQGWGELVIGDPCIVRDDEAGAWRMFLFALPPGHAQALCTTDPCDPAAWQLEGPLAFTNPDAIAAGGAYKPFVVLDPHVPGRAARIRGRYALLLVTDHAAKVVQRAWASDLAGPWTLEENLLITRGTGGDVDARHVDAVSGYYFADRDETLYFYMGYPGRAQPHPSSPFGSTQCTAVERGGSGELRKLGPILRPAEKHGHWAGGWVGGLQLLPGREHHWVGLLNASPTPPDPDDTSIAREEPPPSLGGFAVCDEEWPIRGWRWCDAPIEWIEDVPAGAIENGEGRNLWRHHALVLGDGRIALFYNSGEYFKERLYLKLARL
jgi:hypothetical protein